MSSIRQRCCDRFTELVNKGYLDFKHIYLQKTNAESKFPEHLKQFNYCVICGENINTHRENVMTGPPKCQAINGGRLSERYKLSGDWRSASFNLETVKQYNEHSQSDPKLPERLDLTFCPYCGSKKQFMI